LKKTSFFELICDKLEAKKNKNLLNFNFYNS